MANESTLIVDVLADGEGYKLSTSAVNLEIAYEVVRRHKTDNGTFYSQMTKMVKSSEGYAFTFDTGDVFTATSANACPVSETVADAATPELPEAPEEDGTYILTCEVDTGEVTYTWVAAES